MLKKNTKILIIAITAYIAVFSALSFWKYQNYLYNALDLAIFNQVFFNTSQGRWFEFTIHQHSYLGDHFEPLLLLLAPIYWLFKHPLTLLFLQTLILALAAWPLYFIARNILKKSFLPLLMAGSWLFSPFVHNINLFEFHVLPFAIFFLFWAFYFYQKRKFWPCLVFWLLALLVREDVSLVIFMFGPLALVDSRFRGNDKKESGNDKERAFGNSKHLKWVIVPLLLSILWFVMAMKITGYFGGQGQYKFFLYYTWLGNSFFDIIQNLFIHPLKILKHILALGNLEMLLGFLMPFLFLPLLKPKYLLLALGPFLQFILGSPGGGALIFQTHYASLFLPALFISAIYGLAKILKSPAGAVAINPLESPFVKGGGGGFFQKNKTLLIILLSVTTIYSSLALGPIVPILNKIIKRQPAREVVQLKDYFLKKIPPEASVATTYEFLPKLSSREKLYPLHYVFIGKDQYGQKDFVLPPDTEYLLVDFDDFIDYQIQLSESSFYAEYYPLADDNMRKILENYGIVEIIDSIALFKKDYPNDIQLYQTLQEPPAIDHQLNINLDNKIKLLGWKGGETNNFKFFWQPLQTLSDDYQLQLELTDSTGKTVYQKIYPLAYGLYPTSEWKTDEIIQTNYWFVLPKTRRSDFPSQSALESADYATRRSDFPSQSALESADYATRRSDFPVRPEKPPEAALKISLVKLDGALKIAGDRSTRIVFDKIEILGERVQME